MERIEIAKSADNRTLIPIQAPGGPLYVPRESLERLRPSEIVEIAKSADRNPPASASELEQFQAGHDAMFGGEPESEQRQPDNGTNDCLDSCFTNTETTYAAEI